MNLKKFDQGMLLKIIYSTPGNLYWKDRQGRYLGCNDNFANVLKLRSPNDIFHKTDDDFLANGLAAIIIKNDEQVMQSGQEYFFEEIGVDKDGKKAIYITKKIPLYKNNQVDGILGISIDVTEQRKSEIAKNEFIANISHDLRTPLTGLVAISDSYVNMLSDDVPLKEVFSLMRDSSNQLHQFLEKIIESVKLDNYTELPTELTSFSIKETIQQVVDLFSPAVVSKSLSYTIHSIEQTIDTKLMGYPDLVTRILMNLIGNAVKFTDNGSISISYGLVSNTEDQQTTHNLVLTISDTGKGIPKSKHQAIFERLTRLSPSYKGIYEGQGLGLYITKKLIQLMNGHINVESDGIEGKGSMFICHIPVRLSDEKLVSSDTTLVDIKSVGKERKSDYHVLLADDCKVARYGAKIILENTVPNCTVTEAETLRDIIKCIESNQYDLIIIDLKFSDGDGKQVAKKIRELETSMNQTTPIVALTGDVSKLTEQECIASGIDRVLHKPIKANVIYSVIDEFFM